MKEATTSLIHYGIREARENISKLVNRIEKSSSLAITLGRRDNPSVIMASFERLKHLLSSEPKERIAFLIVENLLGAAPLHIRNPQIEELSKLGMTDLVLLLQIKSLPLTKAREKILKSQLAKPLALERLLKRHKIANAIEKAEKEGLYEAAEHFASQADMTKENAAELKKAAAGE